MWERIIDHLWDDPWTLVPSSAVCKIRCHFHLITAIDLTDRHRTHWLSRVLRETPLLRSRVNRVSIHGSFSGSTRQSIPHLTTFASMLSMKLPVVKVFNIVNVDWRPGAMHADTFLHLSTFASITDLHLYDVTFPSKLVLARLICALPNLLELECVNLAFRSKIWDPAVFCSTPPQIKAVWLDGPSDDVTDLLALQLGTPATAEKFVAGWNLYVEHSPSDVAIMSILQHAGPTLTEVCIWLKQLPGAASEHEGGISTGEHHQHPMFSLSHCSELRALELNYSLPALLAEGRALPSPTSALLYGHISSISSTKLNNLEIYMDVRCIDAAGPSYLVELARDFLNRQQCARVDTLLTGTQFGSLKRVYIGQMCHPEKPSPDCDSWTPTITARFSKLHSRGILHTAVQVGDH
ncbi:hypothetical protein DAEQUDRAFT_733712 [Daedalea quercina L-15889]|uniref:F-box domain-containing protein n=1 Tax=Daedalea quercina L-15889 TaxID=1314783 RepID=A0A165KSH4_9APHY|nr:hypothetical protein DAEQUDRAFT_733712 [Daedalea quercina L-15889]